MSQNPLKSTQFQNRIKKIMQTDEDVGKVAAGATFLMSCAIDAFLDTLLGGAAEVASSRSARTLTASHLKSSIHASPLLDFCKEAVAAVPELPPPGAKRSRAAGGEGGSAPKQPRGRGGGRGRGRGRGQAAAAPTAPGDSAAAAAAAAAVQEALQPAMDAAFLAAAPGAEAEEEDYDEE